MTRVFTLLLFYYLLGAIAITVINRRDHGGMKAGWAKLGVYVLITSFLTFALYSAPWLAIGAAALIVLIGWFELERLAAFRGRSRIMLLCCYAVVALLFCAFVADAYLGWFRGFVYVVVLSFDGFSQISGQLIGGRRLMPHISPGKTYSGLAGGLFMGIATAAYLMHTISAEVVFDAAIICLLAFSGDMIASAVKRRAGIKDYSSFIPGHGGMLDRFDSFLFTGAVLECYFRFI